jgi:putative membrane protein
LSQSSASKSIEPVVVRPSIRLVRPFYSLSILLIVVVFAVVNNTENTSYDWLFVIPAVLLVWTIVRHIKLRFTTLKLESGKLRYQTGMLSKSTRTLEIAKVQDVQVDQTLTQRLLGIGDIKIETAGESAPLHMRNIDNPQAVADYILESPRSK